LDCPFQEIFPSNKYKLKNELETYTLIIFNPKVEDTGKYTIEMAGITCTAYLTVDGTFIFNDEPLLKYI
jgi:hypothetical protein